MNPIMIGDRLMSFIFDNKIHFALCFLSLAIAFNILLRNAINIIPALIVSLSALVAFQINRLTDTMEDSHNDPAGLSRALKNKHAIYILMGVSTVTLSLLSLIGGFQSFLAFISAYITGIFYSINPIFKIFKFKNIFIIKNIIPPFLLAFGIVIYPIIFSHIIKVDMPTLLVFFYIFIDIFIIDVLCDIRDMEGDRLAGISTLPIRFGTFHTKMILICIKLLLLAFLILFSYFEKITNGLFKMCMISSIVLYPYFRDYKPEKLRIINNFWIVLLILLNTTYIISRIKQF